MVLRLGHCQGEALSLLFPEPSAQPLCPGLADALGSSLEFLGALVQARKSLLDAPAGG